MLNNREDALLHLVEMFPRLQQQIKDDLDIAQLVENTFHSAASEGGAHALLAALQDPTEEGALFYHFPLELLLAGDELDSDFSVLGSLTYSNNLMRSRDADNSIFSPILGCALLLYACAEASDELLQKNGKRALACAQLLDEKIAALPLAVPPTLLSRERVIRLAKRVLTPLTLEAFTQCEQRFSNYLAGNTCEQVLQLLLPAKDQ